MKNEEQRVTGLASASGIPHSALRRGGRVVYCGGLENRFGFAADGGSNPSLSARQHQPGCEAFMEFTL
jgi:hypothetical protein